jgi:hypothetical protein
MSGFQPPVRPSNGSHGRLCEPGTGYEVRGALKGARVRPEQKTQKEVFMLKKLTVICGLLLAATAAMAGLPWPWMPMDSTPFPVGEGAHITYGNDRIWGMFPTEDSSRTFVYYYSPLPAEEDTNDPNVGEWCSLPRGNSRWFGWTLAYTGMTYQWGKALYVIGADTSDDEEPPQGWLDWYSLERDTWLIYDIDEDSEFVLDEGACIAYAPNLGYSSSNQAEGYIYCLPGDGTEFWRYSIEPDTDIVVAGIFPPNSSVIADTTPLFQWTGGLIQYRLQVAADPSFGPGSCVIDAVVSATEYQTPSKLANDTFYWRTGTPNGLNWTWASARSFTLEGGFVRLHNIDKKVAKGAAMAYTAFDDNPSIYVLTGKRSDVDNTFFCRWDIDEEEWDSLPNTPKPQAVGTSLTSPDPVTGNPGWFAVAAAFGQTGTGSHPYGYGDEWWEYDSAAFEDFPRTLGPGATFVMGPSPWCYLTTGAPYVGGDPTKYFYAIDPREAMKNKKDKKDKNRGGSQAGYVLAGTLRAQAIASSHGGIEVEYQLPAAARVRATLHDAVGRQVGVLDIGVQEPGTHRLGWNQDRGGRKLASGAYFVLIDMGSEKSTLKAVIR